MSGIEIKSINGMRSRESQTYGRHLTDARMQIQTTGLGDSHRYFFGLQNIDNKLSRPFGRKPASAVLFAAKAVIVSDGYAIGGAQAWKPPETGVARLSYWHRQDVVEDRVALGVAALRGISKLAISETPSIVAFDVHVESEDQVGLDICRQVGFSFSLINYGLNRLTAWPQAILQEMR